MDIVYLTVEQVISIHFQILQNTVEDIGECPGMSIDSAINRIDDHVYYSGLNDIFEIAALYAIAIAKGHCFNNGNKRTAMVSMVVFLFTNNIFIECDNTEIENLMVDIVEDKIDQTELSNWLRSHVQIRS